MDGVNLFAVGMAAVAAAGAAWSAYLGYLSQRDKITHDAELLTLRREVKDCGDHRAEQAAEIVALRAEIAELRFRLDAYLVPPERSL